MYTMTGMSGGKVAMENLRWRRGRLIFPARRPAALVVPLALITEVGGIICIKGGATIGWFIMAAPVFALLLTGVILRPTLELTRDGIVQRQYPFSSLTKWEVIDHFGITRAGNRLILAYKLIPNVPAPRRQPAAGLLKAAQQPFDGGYFADAIAGESEQLLATVNHYLHDSQQRELLPAAQR